MANEKIAPGTCWPGPYHASYPVGVTYRHRLSGLTLLATSPKQWSALSRAYGDSRVPDAGRTYSSVRAGGNLIAQMTFSEGTGALLGESSNYEADRTEEQEVQPSDESHRDHGRRGDDVSASVRREYTA